MVKRSPHKRIFHKESDIQKQCVKWFRLQHRDKILFAIPNEAKRSFALAAHMKALGLEAGVPDLFLAYPTHPWRGLFIEMKSEKGKCTVSQEKMQDAVV